MVSVAFRTLALGLLVLGLCACGAHHDETSAVGAIGAAVAWSPDGGWIAWDDDGRIWVARLDMSEAHAITPPIDALGRMVWISDRELVYWANSRLYSLTPGAKNRLISLWGGDSDFSAGGISTLEAARNRTPAGVARMRIALARQRDETRCASATPLRMRSSLRGGRRGSAPCESHGSASPT
jgi:hypothetical protein